VLLEQLRAGGPDASSALDRLATWFVAVDRDIERGSPIDDDTTRSYAYTAIDFIGLVQRPFGVRPTFEALEIAARITRLHKLSETGVEVELNFAHVLNAAGRSAEAQARLERAVVELADAVINLPMLYVELSQCLRARGDRRAAQTCIDHGDAICREHKSERDPKCNAPTRATSSAKKPRS